MSVQLEISAETAQLLLDSAALHRLSLDEYLRNFTSPYLSNATHLVDIADFERDMDELARVAETLQTLPDDFSRADIYAEHD